MELVARLPEVTVRLIPLFVGGRVRVCLFVDDANGGGSPLVVLVSAVGADYAVVEVVLN